MATRWVIDASIATKLLTDEPDSALARDLVERRSLEAPLMAPPLLRYEVGNAVTRKGSFSGLEPRLQQALAAFEVLEPQDAARFCPALSYYDAAYLALAIEQKAGLLTADAALRKVARRHGVPVGP